ncbi:Alcohol dehydrogenase superfamily, zinc-containing [Beauveria bassiana ARSEF 2860]|uniref:Alcohol dehydrogenase superfamily, zinc-containing n=1 Tax=Beauveria bassiana (strain ARSEF 2860) TaxID=655819 RepID=J5K9T4_BEAB2|nr:Alcohol dehydrogenase superfamily, zinc-containing [Beauveria bassiana ARSEF 2860]EJP70906.1 Alcohol dehydrogenase superfamily, zinc-containing [Beauveria bassiana ARSEF 2860]
MKAILIDKFCETLGQVRVSEVPSPEATGDNILIQVRGVGVNYVDTLYALGKHQNNKRHVTPPFILGLEFAGIVLAAPADCEFQKGDAVFGDHAGAYAEAAAGLAATLPVAYDGLVSAGRLRAGETVLVHAAAGGLGVMACQIAASRGCRVIGTAGSDDKCKYAKGYGASECVNYTADKKWWEKVNAMTGGRGVDVVFDPVGLVEPSLRCMASKGRIVVVGFAGLDGNFEKIAMNRILLKQVELIGYRFGQSLRENPARREEIWEQLYPMLEYLSVKPTLSVMYEGLESVPRALRDISERKIFGKAVVRPAIGGSVHRL